jgi:hypothetical protein
MIEIDDGHYDLYADEWIYTFNKEGKKLGALRFSFDSYQVKFEYNEAKYFMNSILPGFKRDFLSTVFQGLLADVEFIVKVAVLL